MKLIQAMATVAGLTGVSRIAGFIRDILTAVILGAGPISDAFFVALKLPNFFRRVTAEGAFSVSFVPLYTKTLEAEGEEKANAFASNAMAVMLFGLLGITLLVVFFMPYVVYLIAPGFKGDWTRYPMAVEMARVTFPYLMMMSIAALFGGILNAHGKFAPFAAAPILFNVSLIFFLLISGAFKNAGYAMSWGIFIAGILQCGMLWHFVVKYGIKLQFRLPDFGDEKVGRLLQLMGPGVLGAGVMHVNLFADLILASFLDAGAISYLYYADRLNQLPLGLVGIAVGTALLPMLSRAMAAEDKTEATDLFNKALEVCLMLALPAAVGLFMLAGPILVTLFVHGEFTYHDQRPTMFVLMAYSLGIPAYVCAKVFSTSYWAQQDTMTPVRAAIASTVVNIVVSIFLIGVLKIGVAGIALGTAVAGWVQVVLLARGLSGRPENRLSERLRRSLKRIGLACFLMAAFIFATKFFTRVVYYPNMWDFVDMNIFIQAGVLVLIIGVSMAIYGGTLVATGVLKPKDFKKLISKPNEVKTNGD